MFDYFRNKLDCNNVCSGTAIEDECGECGGEGIPDDYCTCTELKAVLNCWDNSNPFEEVEVQLLICPPNESQYCEDYQNENGDYLSDTPDYDSGCPVEEINGIPTCNYVEGSDGCTVNGQFTLGDESCCVVESMMCPDNWEGFSQDYQEYILGENCPESEYPSIYLNNLNDTSFQYIGFSLIGDEPYDISDVFQYSLYETNPDIDESAVQMSIPYGTIILYQYYDNDGNLNYGGITYNQGITLPFPPFTETPDNWSGLLDLQPGIGYQIKLPIGNQAWLKWKKGGNS